MTTITVDIPSAMWLSSNHRHHWRAKASRTAEIRLLARYAARDLAPVAWPANCDVSVGLPTARRFDPHNSAPSLKACLDGIVDAGVLPDDSSDHIPATTFRRDPEPTPRGRYRLTIRLEPVA